MYADHAACLADHWHQEAVWDRDVILEAARQQPQAQGDELAGIEACTAAFGQVANHAVAANKQANDKALGRHTDLLPKRASISGSELHMSVSSTSTIGYASF